MYRILFLFYLFAPIFSYSQSQEYYFNNTLQGTNGGGDLTSVLSCSATIGGFSSNIITTTAGLCGTFDTYCFSEGEGFAYPNTGITDEYTINMFFKFNSLSGYSRLIDFSNGTSDTGFYILNDCLNLYPNGNIGTCPFFLPNIYYLLTFVRNATTNFISVYVNGTLFGSYSDTAGTYKLATNSTPIIFFRDDVPVPCEDKPGCVKYISITPNVQTASQVNATWLNVCNIVSPCPTLPIATITSSIPSKNICVGTSTNIQFSGTPNATVTYTVNNGTNQTIVLDATGNATLPTGNLSINTTYDLISAELGTCFQIQSGTETVTVNPIPTATIFGTPAICSGSNTNLNIVLTGTEPWSATYSDGVTPVTVTGITASPFTPAVSPTFLTTYTVTAVSDSNCAGTFSGTETVTVNPITTATISGTSAICSGSNTNLNIALTGTQPWSVTYSDGVTPVTVTGITASPFTPAVSPTFLTTYTVTAVSDTNCVGTFSGTETVTVNPIPTATISGTPAICSGSNTNLNIVLTGTQPWSVTYSDGITPVTVTGITASLFTPAVSPTFLTTYTVTAVSDTNCVGSFSGTETVTVNTIPTATISGTPAICSGSNTNLNIVLTGTQPWSVTYSDGVTPITVTGITASPFTPAVSPTFMTTYTVTAVSDTNCVGTFSGTETITVNPIPTATISGTTAICSGTGTTISFSGTPNATVTYKINSGPNRILVLDAVGKSTLVTGALTANSSYDLVSVALGTCSQTQTGNATVSINAPPTASISGTTAICSGTGTNITFNGTPNATVTYKINAGSNQTIVLDASGTTTLATGNLTVLTSYDLVSVLSGTCSQTQTGNATVSINLKPIISSSTGSNFICVEWKTNVLLAGLTLECNSNSANFTFQWQLNNINIPGATSQNYTINSATPGIYKVFTKSISPLGCSNESNEFVVIQSGPASFLNPPFTVSNFFSENQNITAHIEGYGNYEYSIDGNLFQSSNTFNTVSTGTHYITIKDINSDCDEVIIKNITTIDYPKFFSPNNDGINDIWTIKDLSKTLKARIIICDRFGKLIKVIQPSDIGWDGTLNGYNLPAADYWFTINYTEDSQPKIFKSHFSLVR
jgi:gliding motility-associated-like protein